MVNDGQSTCVISRGNDCAGVGASPWGPDDIFVLNPRALQNKCFGRGFSHALLKSKCSIFR